MKNYKDGWGNVIRVIHYYNNTLYESVYAHCDTIVIKENTFVEKGQSIATIGNCNDLYLAHLHFEIRDSVNMDIGPGYSTNSKGYLDPTKFIENERN